ncbi:diaminopimelate decarboxylase [Caldicellulosiruptor morganii]|uniref:Diaminopimelate decarboxylase n=1 Tax=Caldicellulosiruptor morganii TaxID=1387555 RepID=A0ABY7BPN4_9FIRM|nr:diaminopimelate decarboxylase [Caldicellulosiruptor morganii]WAM34408.1 diaminopimelate decarboxylase [Caldicellulosiruptor morganii]
MQLRYNLEISPGGNLSWEGIDLLDLVEMYGTPLYVMNERMIRENINRFKSALQKYFGEDGLIIYASKAFCTKAMCQIAKQEGIGLDVVSGGELYTALSVDFPTDRIFFHGNNKTYDELDMAVENGIKIVIDNFDELELLSLICKTKSKKADVLIRVKPGIEAHTHEFIRTGQIDSKFGVTLENGEAFSMVKRILTEEHLNLVGLHCHIGSQIFETAPFKLAARVMLEFILKIKKELGYDIHILDLGGGFGIKYTAFDQPPQIEKFIEAIAEEVEEFCQQKGIKKPFIVLEPGRSIVGEAGITLYTIGGIKEIPNVRNYASVDGGMTDNPRYALYQAKYDAYVVENPLGERTKVYTIAGRCCESGDILIKDIKLPELKVGQHLAILATGAYNYSMSSNYNRFPRPAVVLLKDGQAKIIVKRETYEDIVRNDLEI